MSEHSAIEILRREFDSEDGSFLLRLRGDLAWDEIAFERVTDAMRHYVERNCPAQTLERWVAEGFWCMDTFVANWSSHPNFHRVRNDRYYAAAYGYLTDLAAWLFVGQCPNQSGRMPPFSEVLEKMGPDP